MLPKKCDVELIDAALAVSQDGLLVAGGLVACPFCGKDDMRPRRVRVYQRPCPDSKDGVLFDSATFPQRMHPSAMRENPSKHRSGLRMDFHCKHCMETSCLLIIQEGEMGERTLVVWESEEPFEAVVLGQQENPVTSEKSY